MYIFIIFLFIPTITTLGSLHALLNDFVEALSELLYDCFLYRFRTEEVVHCMRPRR